MTLGLSILQPGHGRGLVDAIPPPLVTNIHLIKHEILTNDIWLEYSSDMDDYLVSYFQLHKCKEYNLKDSSELAHKNVKD